MAQGIPKNGLELSVREEKMEEKICTVLGYNNPITFHSAETTCNFHTWEYGRMLFTQFDSEYI